MRTIVIAPPEPLVAWEDADAHLRLDGDLEQQRLVEGLIAAASAHIDGPNGWLNRAIGVQTLEARFYLTDCPAIRLPYGPVIDLVSVKYLGDDDVERIADLEDFELFGDDLEPVTGTWAWEGGSARREAGRVQYRAGYETIPAPITAAVLLMVGDMFYNRETTVMGTVSAVPMTTTVEALLAPYRVWG